MQNVLNFKNKLLIFTLVFLSIFTLSINSVSASNITKEERAKQLIESEKYVVSFRYYSDSSNYYFTSYLIFDKPVKFKVVKHSSGDIEYRAYDGSSHVKSIYDIQYINRINSDGSLSSSFERMFESTNPNHFPIMGENFMLFKSDVENKKDVGFKSSTFDIVNFETGDLVFQKPQVPPVEGAMQGVDLLPSLMIIAGSTIFLVGLVLFLRVLVRGLRRVSETY